VLLDLSPLLMLNARLVLRVTSLSLLEAASVILAHLVLRPLLTELDATSALVESSLLTVASVRLASLVTSLLILVHLLASLVLLVTVTLPILLSVLLALMVGVLTLERSARLVSLERSPTLEVLVYLALPITV